MSKVVNRANDRIIYHDRGRPSGQVSSSSSTSSSSVSSVRSSISVGPERRGVAARLDETDSEVAEKLGVSQ